jgi:hypothetical protein
MSTSEIRDSDEARRFLVQGLWLQRVRPPTPATVRDALQWSLAVASGGEPLPPIGFIADLGTLAFGLDREERADRGNLAIPGLSAAVARAYEDYVLGKFYADWTFERAGDALRRYQGRDRGRGLAFVINQFRARAAFDGVHLSPAVIRAALERPPEEVLAQGWESLRGGLMPLLAQLYESLIASARSTAEVLGPEDIFELERGTALADLGQRVALRQVLQAAERFESVLPHQPTRISMRREEVPTQLLEEDTYPVGGFASLSNRGSLESLLFSQLAYMEKEERPDLFDIKYVRNELLYYSRDENQFLRRRRTFLFALFPDLEQARFKDAELPWQRTVLLAALLLAAVRRLTDWLSTDALRFEFLFVLENDSAPLAQEEELLRMLLGEQIANGTVHLDRVHSDKLAPRIAQAARRSLCRALAISTRDRPLRSDAATVTRLRLAGPWPEIGCGEDALARPEAEDPIGGWSAALEQLLRLWL